MGSRGSRRWILDMFFDTHERSVVSTSYFFLFATSFGRTGDFSLTFLFCSFHLSLMLDRTKVCQQFIPLLQSSWTSLHATFKRYVTQVRAKWNCVEKLPINEVTIETKWLWNVDRTVLDLRWRFSSQEWRVRRLGLAWCLVGEAPVPPGSGPVIWTSVVAACRRHRLMLEWIFEKLLKWESGSCT